MKNFTLIVFLLLAVLQQLSSQDFSHEFGQSSIDELQMKYYDKDSTSEAVVLYDIGKSSFDFKDGPLRLIFERSFKIKIFTKAGFDWAKIEIPFYEQDDRAEEFLKLECNTYNYENGIIRTTPLDTNNAFIEKAEKKWRVKKFAMPDIKEGSVIEVKYKISTPYFFNFRSWDFQMKIPVVYSEYTTKMIPLCSYKYILQGTNKLTDFKQYLDPGSERTFNTIFWRDQVYVFVKKDIPAFKDESFITSYKDYIIKLIFQESEYINGFATKVEIMTTWPKLIQKLQDLDSFGGYLRSCKSNAKDIVDTMHLESLTTLDKIEKMQKFVKSNFSWDGNSGKFSSQKVKELLKTKIGNSTDINLFLAGMISAAGIEANPLIISTRENGKIKAVYPFEQFFNYVLVDAVIEGQHIVLDATDPLCNFGMLPPRCLNDVGLVIKKGDEAEWLNFSSPIISSINYTFDLTPGIEKDSINGKFRILASGYEALNYRKKYLKSSIDFKDEVLTNSLTLTDSIQVENLKQIEKLFSIKFNANSSINEIDGKIIVSPFSGYAITENLLKQPSRTYPIEMVYKKKRTFTSTIHVPKGYKTISKPENLTIENDDIKINYLAIIVNDSIVKVAGFYEFKRDVYDASSYLDLKSYFNTIIDKFNEKLILAKE